MWERRYEVNSLNIGSLILTNAVQSNLGEAQRAFVQTMIAAADRLNHIGSGTHVFAGTTTRTDVTSADCLDPYKRHLIVIRTSASENPFNLAAQVQPKCLQPDGTYNGYRIVFFARVFNGGQIFWRFSVNGPGRAMSNQTLHEFGHTYSVEHAKGATPAVPFGMVMNSPSGVLKEWDIRCMLYRAGERSYRLLYRHVTSLGIGPEYVFNNLDGVSAFAPGKTAVSNTNSLIYENVLNYVTKWYQDFPNLPVTNISPPTLDSAVDTSFQVWTEQSQNSKYLWSQISNTTLWDTAWNIKIRTYITGTWSSVFNLTKNTPTNALVRSQFTPSIAHIDHPTFGQRTISVWSETNPPDTTLGEDDSVLTETQTTWIASGILGSTGLNGSKSLVYTLPNLQSVMVNPYVPMSIACRATDNLCMVVFIANDFYDANSADPVGWMDKNVIKIGYVNLTELFGSGSSVTLNSVHELPTLTFPPNQETRMRTASRPVVLFDGTNFRIIFRGSYWPGQKLTSFTSPHGVIWTHDTTFDNSSTPFNAHTSYSSVAPAAATYLNGSTILFYSRPLASGYQ